MRIEKVEAVVRIQLDLTPEEAHSLYNEIATVLRIAGVDYAGNRDKLEVPHIYGLYDELYGNGLHLGDLS